MSELPKGWTETTVDVICEKLRGVSYDKKEASREEKDGFIPILRANNIDNDHLTFVDLVFVPRARVSEKQKLQLNDVLVAMSSGSKSVVGKTAQVVEAWHGSFGAFCGVLRPNRQIDGRYFGYFFRTKEYRAKISELSAGTNINNLKNEHFGLLDFPVPPLIEQHRIVAKLDKLLSRADASQARLTTILPILKRFRQSVISAACSGRLTADWRAENANISAASSLVAKLERAHADAGGHKRGNAAPPTDQVHDLTLDELPLTWRMTDLRTAVCPDRPITYGILKPGPDTSGGIPYVRVADFPNDRLNLTTIRRTTIDIEKVFARARLREGDILLSIRGTVGRVCQVPAELTNANITQDTARLSIQPGLETGFVMWFLRANTTQKRMQKAVKGVAVRGINIGDVRALQLPVPPFREQQEIVRRVEALFKTADALEARYRTAKAHVNKLSQSILAKAFRGELVVQDEKDESAAVLLERVKVERASKLVHPKVVAIAARGTGQTKASPHSKGIFYRRAALDCYVIENLQGDPHLGRTKMEKISHLLEHHCGVDLERVPIRDAAGPNDYPSRINVESLARKQKWYSTQKREGGDKVDYLQGPEIQKSRHTAINFLGQRKVKVDALLALLRPLDTKRVEVVATLYASWNDFLLNGRTPTDDELIDDVRNHWHPDKQSIPNEWWIKTLGWMRRKQLIPKGTGRPVTHKSHGERSPALSGSLRKNKSKKQRRG